MRTTTYTFADGRTFTLRMYGHPGKYEGECTIAELLHQLSMVGTDEEEGDANTVGWYGLMYGPFTDEVGESEYCNACTPDERAFLTAIAGAIVTEDSQGFVSVQYFETAAQLQAEWADIVSAVGAVEASEEE